MGRGSVASETITEQTASHHIGDCNADSVDPRVYNEFDATPAEKTQTLKSRGASGDTPSYVQNALFTDRPLSPSNFSRQTLRKGGIVRLVGVQYAGRRGHPELHR